MHTTDSSPMAVKSKVQRLNKRAKKQQKWKEQLSKNKSGKTMNCLSNCGLILGAFWINFGSQKAFKNRVKFWMRFWSRKRRLGRFSEHRPAECAGSMGRIMEGARVKSCQQSEGKDRSSGLGCSTPSRVGRRIAPRIPPG